MDFPKHRFSDVWTCHAFGAFFEKSVFPHKRQTPVGFPCQPRARINVSRQKDAKSGVSMVENLYVYLFYVSSRPRPISETWVFKPFVAGGH